MPAGAAVTEIAAPEVELDTDALAAAVQTVLDHRRLSVHKAAAEAHVTEGAMYHLLRTPRAKPSADNLVALLAWLGGDASRFTRRRDPEPAAAPAA